VVLAAAWLAVTRAPRVPLRQTIADAGLDAAWSGTDCTRYLPGDYGNTAVVEVREAAVRRHDGQVVLVEDSTGAGGGATVSGTVDDGTVDNGTVDNGTVDNGTVLLEVMHAVHTAAALEAATSSGVLAALSDVPATAEQVAHACGTSARHTELLLVAMQALGLAERDDRGRFRQAGPPVAVVELMRRAVAGTGDVVRTGRPPHAADTTEGAQKMYPAVVSGLSVIFERPAGTAARLLAPAGRVLDVGAGAAPWTIALAHADPGATVTALDLPSVLPVTQAEVEAAGLANRFTFYPADVLTCAIEPGGYDLILLANLCHLFDEEVNRGLVRRLADGLAPNGRLAVIDILPEAIQRGSRRSAVLALYELGLSTRTATGRVHPFAAYQGWVRDADLSVRSVELLDPVFPAHLILCGSSV
jgi:SAM-dependent methyltransferase